MESLSDDHLLSHVRDYSGLLIAREETKAMVGLMGEVRPKLTDMNQTGENQQVTIRRGTLLRRSPSNKDEYDVPEDKQCSLHVSASASCLEELDAMDAAILSGVTVKEDRFELFQSKDWLRFLRELRPGTSVLYSAQEHSTPVMARVEHINMSQEHGGLSYGLRLLDGNASQDNETSLYYAQSLRSTEGSIMLKAANFIRPLAPKHAARHPGSSTGNVEQLEDQYKPAVVNGLQVGDRVVWQPGDHPGVRHGTVRWIGCSDKEPRQITVGIESDTFLGSGTGTRNRQVLFRVNTGHAVFVPLSALMKEEDYKTEPLYNQKEYQRSGPGSVNTTVRQTPSLLPHSTAGSSAREHPVTVIARADLKMSIEESSSSYQSGQCQSDYARQMPINSKVEVRFGKQSYRGVLKWKGRLHNRDYDCAGVELDQDVDFSIDGVYPGLFESKPKRGVVVQFTRDLVISFESPVHTGVFSHPYVGPLAWSSKEIPLLEGRYKGIQGNQNSCYLDAVLFSMFCFENSFDYLFQRKYDDHATDLIKTKLADIVYTLRRDKFVPAEKTMELRKLLETKTGEQGLTTSEKDPEELLQLLFEKVFKVEPLLKLGPKEGVFTFQLILDQSSTLDKNIPTLQDILEMYCFHEKIHFEQEPNVLIVTLPRFGSGHKVFQDKVIPNLELDITDLVLTSAKECDTCTQQYAARQCDNCYSVAGRGRPTFHCERCWQHTHGPSTKRRDHVSTALKIPEFPVNPEDADIDVLDRATLQLFAVICIKTSHYITFVRTSKSADAQWVFFDSMSDRIGGDIDGSNIPAVRIIEELKHLNDVDSVRRMAFDKKLSEDFNRLLSDVYICMYRNLRLDSY